MSPLIGTESVNILAPPLCFQNGSRTQDINIITLYARQACSVQGSLHFVVLVVLTLENAPIRNC